MAAVTTPNMQQTQKRAHPPKRGKIKAQIFESFVETVSSLFSSRGGDGAGGDDDFTSASTTNSCIRRVLPSSSSELVHLYI
ncbi:hypothetical protein A4A49_33438 [Nicotiana attenuata]|uniref:Uncharacterized protein n=1 Tax=Nicotiana attenuata TaxID=49451 RepID=A0A314L9N2_NICAT|nr:hypothetical protein A4A49_33438 [Nicotiana attenuata]